MERNAPISSLGKLIARSKSMTRAFKEKEVRTLEQTVPLMFVKSTEQSVQIHAVPTGTSDVVALPEQGSIAAPLDYSHSRSRSKCARGECMSSALKRQRIRSARSDWIKELTVTQVGAARGAYG